MKNVLILGDSISIGYTPEVTRRLEGKALVTHNPGNAMYSSYGLKSLPGWLGQERWDVIHFNWGIWDLHHMMPSADPLEPSVDSFDHDGVRRTTAEQYEANLRGIVKILKTTGAELIWATITPLPENKTMAVIGGHEVLYNAVSRRVMDENSIAVNDLHGYALPEIGQIQPPEDVHFTDEGYVFLGIRVAEFIEAALARQATISRI